MSAIWPINYFLFGVVAGMWIAVLLIKRKRRATQEGKR